jgi:CheY-like chemotaxis protein
VLFMTGYAHPHVLDPCVDEAATAVLTKPFGLDTLGANVNALLRDGSV